MLQMVIPEMKWFTSGERTRCQPRTRNPGDFTNLILWDWGTAPAYLKQQQVTLFDSQQISCLDLFLFIKLSVAPEFGCSCVFHQDFPLKFRLEHSCTNIPGNIWIVKTSINGNYRWITLKLDYFSLSHGSKEQAPTSCRCDVFVGVYVCGVAVGVWYHCILEAWLHFLLTCLR